MTIVSRETAGNKPTAEQLFEQYLADRDLPFVYESHDGHRQPDYRVQHRGANVVLEVKEFHDPAVKPIGGFSVCPAIRRKIHDARRQLAEYKQHACGIVLYNTGSIYRSLSVMSVASACFGQHFRSEPSANGPIHAEGPSFEFFGRAELTASLNTTISAVIILAPYRLDELWLATWRELCRRQQRGFPIEPSDEFDTMVALEPTIQPRYRYEGTIRVIVLHNPYARLHLPPDLFLGPFDQHWGTRNGRYQLLALGLKAKALQQEGVPYVCL